MFFENTDLERLRLWHNSAVFQTITVSEMTNLLISDAWAQAGGGGGSSMFSLLPLALIFVLFYFLLIRPQQRRAKQHKQMVAAMKAGDEVATNGGLLGRGDGLWMTTALPSK